MVRAGRTINNVDIPIRPSVAGGHSAGLSFGWVIALTALHVPLGVLISAAGSLAILHPLAVFCAGLYLAFKKHHRIELVALAIAYLVGSEVLWRMTQVPVFWEFGKYGSAAIAIAALLRRNYSKIPALPLAYLAALAPAGILTLLDTGLSDAQAIFSTQMSGPFFLVIACWFFSYCKFDQTGLQRILIVIVVPLISVAFTTLFYTISIEDIQFTGESNFATSGGFGPNQVSAMLGLGAFLTLTSVLIFQNGTKYRIYYMAAAILFSAQSVMTFSRGGMYNALGAIIAVSLVELRSPSAAARRIAPILGLVVLFLAFVFPVLDDFTGGQLTERFEDTGTSARTEIVESDVQLFLENPVFGVGIGASYSLRERLLGRKAMTHTEFSRLLSEHGLFGVVALLLMAGMIVTNFRKQRTLLGRAFVAGTVVWCVLFMMNASMRLAAPAFMWGMIYSTILPVTRERRDLRLPGPYRKR